MRDKVAVVVIGDIGRSPRMQYHALSLANEANFDVELIGFDGSPVWDDVANNPHIHLNYLASTYEPKSLPWILGKIYKVLYQIILLFYLLMTIPWPKFYFVQTPPAIPILFVAHIVCFLRRSKLAIDWHNYGYTILRVTKGPSSTAVKVYELYERFFGRGADVNFCVSRAMQRDLAEHWDVTATVLYDRPPLFYRKAELRETLDFLKDAKVAGLEPRDYFKDENQLALRADRPAILVTSTSWTEDEDFDMLLDAVAKLDALLQQIDNRKFSKIFLFITGKGELKDYYEGIIASMAPKLKIITIRTVFLSYEAYRILLGSADLGICLHASSSGIDLPMKVVDMFGCGLPVLALKYPAIGELVVDKETGLLFSDAEELAQHASNLLKDFPQKERLREMEANIQVSQSKRWAECWAENAKPLFVAKK